MVSTLPMDLSEAPMSPYIDASVILEPVAAESDKLAFSGNADDSVTDFIQSIQKYAFEQDRSTDDRWISAYVGTCFTDSAMAWYSLLDDKTRNNWAKLRKALINRFGTKHAYNGAPMIGQPPSCVRPVGPACMYSPQIGPLSPREKAPNELRGLIEVFVPERNLWLGHLTCSYEATGTTFAVSGSKSTSALFSFVPDAENKPVQVRVDGPPNDIYHPYIGLAMDDPSLQIQTQNGFCQLPGVPQTYYPGNPIVPQYTGLPIYGQGSPPPMFPNPSFQQPMQTKSVSPSWNLKTCTESSQDERRHRASKTTNLWEKASAAVWKYDPNTKELSITWMNDDGNEEQLAVSVPRPTSPYGGNIRPVIHRARDNTTETSSTGPTPLPQNIPVKLFFVPED